MHALWMSSGILVWALHFAALYGFTSLACARGFGASIPWVAGTATAAALVAMTLIALRAAPRRAGFTAWMTLAIVGFAAIGVMYDAVPLLIVPPCA
jgi:hypothetical protein